MTIMVIQLPARIEEQLRGLAEQRGEAIDALVEDAVREYLVAASVTDLRAGDVAETQFALLGELREIPAWKGGRE